MIPTNQKRGQMIDAETIEDWDDCDGNSIYCYGYNSETKEWEWGWCDIADLEIEGRLDILRQLFPNTGRYQ